jgi:hypothetical protein
MTTPKRYRTRPYVPGILRAYWGKAENWDAPDLVANGLKPDAAMLLNAWTRRESLPPLTAKILGVEFHPSFLQELEDRGYDLTTIQFSIRMKAD